MTATTWTEFAARRGTAEARMHRLHAEHAHSLSRFLTGFTGASPYGAEDLLQETMIQVWRRLADVPAEPESARRWLFTVARNVGIDAVRRVRVRPVCVQLVDDVPGPTGDDTVDTVVAKDWLRTGLRALSTEQRAVLVELHIEGRSVVEVAHRLRVPAGTVKSRAFYALKSLRGASQA